VDEQGVLYVLGSRIQVVVDSSACLGAMGLVRCALVVLPLTAGKEFQVADELILQHVRNYLWPLCTRQLRSVDERSYQRARDRDFHHNVMDSVLQNPVNYNDAIPQE
jgi:hypothetical protein